MMMVVSFPLQKKKKRKETMRYLQRDKFWVLNNIDSAYLSYSKLCLIVHELRAGVIHNCHLYHHVMVVDVIGLLSFLIVLLLMLMSMLVLLLCAWWCFNCC